MLLHQGEGLGIAQPLVHLGGALEISEEEAEVLDGERLVEREHFRREQVPEILETGNDGGAGPALGPEAREGEGFFPAFLVHDHDFCRACLCNGDGEQGQTVLVREGDLRRFSRFLRHDDNVEDFLFAVGDDEVIALPEVGLQVVALAAVQFDVYAGLQVEAGDHPGEIVDVGGLDDGWVHAKAHLDALVEAGVEHRAARGAFVRVPECEQGVRMLGDALAGRAVDVPVQVEKPALGQVEEGPERSLRVHLATSGEAVGVDAVQLGVVGGEDEAPDLVHDLLRHDRGGLPELLVHGLLVQDLHRAPSPVKGIPRPVGSQIIVRRRLHHAVRIGLPCRMQGLVDGLLAGYGIAIPVGAVSILIVTTGMVSGFRTGFAAGAGAATADLIYATAASAAGTALVIVLQPVARYFRIAGGVALLLMAAIGFIRGVRRTKGSGDEARPARSTGAGATFVQFLGITLVNPLTVVYFAALVLGREGRGAALLVDRLAFVVGAACASLSWQTLLAAMGSIFHGRLSDRFRAGASIAGSLIVAALGARILVMALR